MVSCSEVWYDLKEEELRKLEQCDESLPRKILNCSSQVPFVILYLELCVLLARFIIMLRRLSYLQLILKQSSKKSLLFQFFKAQLENPTKNDWAIQAIKYVAALKMNINLDEIEDMSTEKFTKNCKEKFTYIAFQYLEEKQTKVSKECHI